MCDWEGVARAELDKVGVPLTPQVVADVRQLWEASYTLPGNA